MIFRIFRPSVISSHGEHLTTSILGLFSGDKHSAVVLVAGVFIASVYLLVRRVWVSLSLLSSLFYLLFPS